MSLSIAAVLTGALSCLLLVAGFEAKTDYLIWWFWVAPLLAALATAAFYPVKRAGWRVVAFAAFFLVGLVAQSILFYFTLADRLN